VNADELDEVYSELCHRMTAQGEEGALLYLGRLVLLLANEVGDADKVSAAIRAAEPEKA
jgi:hypothetical protein